MITTENNHKKLINGEITFVRGRNYPNWQMAQIGTDGVVCRITTDRKSTRLNSSHASKSRMPSSA